MIYIIRLKCASGHETSFKVEREAGNPSGFNVTFAEAHAEILRMSLQATGCQWVTDTFMCCAHVDIEVTENDSVN